MGTNRRYAHRIDEQMDRRIIETVMRDHQPESLTAEELELDVEPLTRPPQPIPVEARVRYGSTPVKVRGLATAWTGRAVAVKWPAPDGSEHRAWLWRGATRGGS